MVVQTAQKCCLFEKKMLPAAANDMSDGVRHDILADGQYDMLLRNMICSAKPNVE